jgi:hypothetical protein
MHLHVYSTNILRQVANNIASLGRVAIDINGKNRCARLIHAYRGAENFRLLLARNDRIKCYSIGFDPW